MKRLFLVFGLGLLLLSFVVLRPKPVLYIIGDSTVRNGDGSGKNRLWGWGSVIGASFDTVRIGVRNHAIGGRSSRTFLTDGRWATILDALQPGDFVLMQFGHNDGAALDDTARARGTLKGIGEDSVTIYNPIRKQQEVVHSYGWYMRKYANEARAKGAVAIICSPIPRNVWKGGKVVRAEGDYGGWARQVAVQTGAFFIDLNELIAARYEQMDTASVTKFFPGDHTHTNREGAELNALQVVNGVRSLRGCSLKDYLIQ